jgi:hypothetical protein
MEVAAAEKLPVSAMPRSACRCFNSTAETSWSMLAAVAISITITDAKYLLKLLD